MQADGTKIDVTVVQDKVVKFLKLDKSKLGSLSRADSGSLQDGGKMLQLDSSKLRLSSRDSNASVSSLNTEKANRYNAKHDSYGGSIGGSSQSGSEYNKNGSALGSA